MRPLLVVVSLAACGGSPKPPPVANEPAAPVETEAEYAHRQAIEQARAAGVLDQITTACAGGGDDGFGGATYGCTFSTLTGQWERTTIDEYGRHQVELGGGIGHGVAVTPPPPTGPQVSIGPPQSQSGLDKEVIRRIMRLNLAKLRACYEHALVTQPDLAGTVAATFTIDRAGAVSAATATGIDAAVATCVADAIRGFSFPAPHGGGNVVVNYPLVFKTAP